MTTYPLTLVFAATCLATLAIMLPVRYAAVRWRLMDSPNSRSSVPTPRGGGLSIVLCVCGAIVLCLFDSNLTVDATWWILAGAVVLAITGLIDDRNGLPWHVRFALHIGTAALATTVIGPSHILASPSTFAAVAVFGVVVAIGGAWATNLFNFMDGINGIAGQEALFIGLGGALASLAAGAQPAHLVPLLAIAGAALGFLPWNFPRARIFLGDVGSGFLGFSLYFFPLLLTAQDHVPSAVWVILWGTFLCDASVTLARRVVRRERLSQAHRSHLYQRLALRLNSHPRATMIYALINLIWLLPLALAAASHPNASVTIAIVALLPLVAAAAVGSSRRAEH